MFFLAAIVFGLNALFARMATHLGGMSGSQATLVRFAIGLLAVLGIFAARPGTFRPREYPLLAARAIFGGLSALAYFKALALISAGEATLLNNTFPIWGVLLSLAFLRERPTVHLALALLIASAGVFLVTGSGQAHFALGRGQLLALGSGVFGGAAVTAIRALRATNNAPTIFFAFSLGGLVSAAPAVLEPWPRGAMPWLAALGVGLAAFVAQMLMTEAYGALSVAEAAIWQQLTPIASFAWALTLGERVTAWTMLGVALGIAGIVYGTVLGGTAGDDAAALTLQAEAERPD
jgi:drug/metabolite transporter (DMT)-like permease